ncbi:MAG TPA: hypothetical protein VHI78_10305 [Bacteroidales bacterium]|nr:hypothetical protein [Bacteroidales bacterium]
MMKFRIILLAGVFYFASCDKSEDTKDLLPVSMGYEMNYKMYSGTGLNDTIYIDYRSCIQDYAKQNRVCFDSVLSDSRCPKNVVCIWAGEATARFTIDDFRNSPVQADLRLGTLDTLIQGLRISFVALEPYPDFNNPHKTEEYKAGIVIKRP